MLALVPLMAAMASGLSGGQPFTVVVRVAGALDQALLARVRGSASDLPVRIVAAGTGPLEAEIGQQLAAAAALVARERADAALWFQPMSCAGQPAPAAGLIIQVSQPASGYVLVRPIDGAGCGEGAESAGPEAPAPSALLEAAALAVRTVLLGLTGGGSIESTPRPQTAAGAPGVEGRGPAARPVALRAGVLAVIDGVSRHGQEGLAAAVAIGGGRWALEVGLSSTLVTPVSDGATEIWVSRAGLTAGLLGRLPLSGDLTGVVTAQVGAALIFRGGATPVAGVMAEPDRRSVSPLGTGELRLAWTPAVLRGAAVVFGGGVDYLRRLPPLVYRRADQTETRRQQWPVQPRLFVGFELRL